MPPNRAASSSCAARGGKTDMTFSIVIPVYNVASYLLACLDSVANLVGAEWECVCVDDGSTDGSGAILEEQATKDARFKVFHQANAGVSAARNFGLEQSQGDWVLFMDSDDVIAPNALAKVAAAVRRDDCEMVTFEMCRVKDVHEYVPPQADGREIAYDMRRKEDAVAFFQKNFPGRLWAWNKCIRRTHIGELRFESYQPWEDAVFVLTCAISAVKIIELPDVFYKYLQHDGSCLDSVTPKRIDGDLRGWKRLVEVTLGWRFAESVRRSLQQTMKDGVLPYITNQMCEIATDTRAFALLRKQYVDFVRAVFCDLPLYGRVERMIFRCALAWCKPVNVLTRIRIASAFIGLPRMAARAITKKGSKA